MSGMCREGDPVPSVPSIQRLRSFRRASGKGNSRKEARRTVPFSTTMSEPSTPSREVPHMKPIATKGESFGLSATFVLSVADPHQMPPPGEGTIVGLAGRSNVGKSSLINRLTERGGLARIGKRPGATTLPNLYRIYSGGYFLDFPGYGYMNRGQSTKASSQDASTRIVEARPDIRRVLLLVDARREILSSDVEAARYFRMMAIPVTIVVTKTDTLSRNGRDLPLRGWSRWIQEENDKGVDGPYPVSARTGEGLPELVRHVREVLSGGATGG